MRYLLALLVFCVAFSAATADDIVTMPTANQLKAGELDAAAYYLQPGCATSPAPEFVQYQTLYVGLTDRLEVDAHRAAIAPTTRPPSCWWAASSCSPRSATKPDLVFGCRNITGEATVINPPGSPVDFREQEQGQLVFPLRRQDSVS